MARKKHRKLLIAAGVGVGGLAAWHFLYKPWAARRAAALLDAATPAAGGGGALPGYLPSYSGGSPSLPSPAAMLSQPPTIALTPVGAPTSIGQKYAGPVGAALAVKPNWTPEYAQNRLQQLQDAAARARTALAQFAAGAANPAAAGIPMAQAELTRNQVALTGAKQAFANLTAQGDLAGAAAYGVTIAGLEQNIIDLTNRIAAASKPVDNSAAIAAYQGALAANDDDYFALTGTHL